jgi:aerobic carbon-monoxide dehydrogenase medium subunit
MKPAPFSYHRPTTLREALAILAEVAGDDGRVLAGGQTLIPMMALRMATPAHLVDINGIAELSRIAVENNELAIGALARHADFERPVQTGPTGCLLAEVSRHIAHYPIRTRGTFCGSLANADPASEWCMVAVALDASLRLASHAGERILSADEFGQGAMMTSIEPEELLVEVRMPLLPPDTLFGFHEVSRRAGDFALAMSLSTLRLADGVVVEVAIAVGGAEDKPRRIREAEDALRGRPCDAAAIAAVAEVAAEAIDPMEDAATDAGYRRDLVRAAVSRALAAASASGHSEGACAS